MKNQSHGAKRQKRLPVFISPEELQFIGEDEASHKQILTVYNPYDFSLSYKGWFYLNMTLCESYYVYVCGGSKRVWCLVHETPRGV